MTYDDFKVEPDVPIPPPHRRIYPFATMQVGDSFAFDGDRLKAVRAAAQTYGKRNDKTFSCRQVGTDVWRCWRIK